MLLTASSQSLRERALNAITPFRVVSVLLLLGLLWTLYSILVEPDLPARTRQPEVTLPRLQLRDVSRGLGPVRAGRTLVIYLYSDQEPEAEVNLQFFLRWGVGGAGDGCEYVIVAKNGEHHDSVRSLKSIMGTQSSHVEAEAPVCYPMHACISDKVSGAKHDLATGQYEQRSAQSIQQ